MKVFEKRVTLGVNPASEGTYGDGKTRREVPHQNAERYNAKF